MTPEQAIAVVDWKIRMRQDIEQFEKIRQSVIARQMIERHANPDMLYSWQQPQVLVPLEKENYEY
jgi:tRNA uridine 5-carbamoylmethylation protein Kti12